MPDLLNLPYLRVKAVAVNGDHYVIEAIGGVEPTGLRPTPDSACPIFLPAGPGSVTRARGGGWGSSCPVGNAKSRSASRSVAL